MADVTNNVGVIALCPLWPKNHRPFSKIDRTKRTEMESDNILKTVRFV